MKPPEKAEWEGRNSQACWNGLPHPTQRASLWPPGRSKKWILVRLALSEITHSDKPWENQALHSWILPLRRSWWAVPGAKWVENKGIPARKVGHSATPEVDVGHTSVSLSTLGGRGLDPYTPFIYPQSWQHPSVWTILDLDFGPALSLRKRYEKDVNTFRNIALCLCEFLCLSVCLSTSPRPPIAELQGFTTIIYRWIIKKSC